MPRSRVRSPRSCPLRRAAGLGPQTILPGPVPQQVPRGLDDPALGLLAQGRDRPRPIRGTRQAFKRIIGKWWEETVLVLRGHDRLGPGAPADHPRRPARERKRPPASPRESRVCLLRACFAAVYTAGPGAAQHVARLSVGPARHGPGRRLDPLGRGGTYVCCRRIGELLRLGPRAASRRPARGDGLRLDPDRRPDEAEPSESSEPVGPLGGRTLAVRRTRRPASWSSTPAAGPGSSRAIRATTTGTSARRSPTRT